MSIILGALKKIEKNYDGFSTSKNDGLSSNENKKSKLPLILLITFCVFLILLTATIFFESKKIKNRSSVSQMHSYDEAQNKISKQTKTLVKVDTETKKPIKPIDKPLKLKENPLRKNKISRIVEPIPLKSEDNNQVNAPVEHIKDRLNIEIADENYTAALALANSSLEAYPKNIDIRYYAGLAYFNTKQYKKSAATLVVMQPQFSKYQKYYALLAATDLNLEKYANAKLLYMGLLKDDPANYSYALGLGLAYQRLGDITHANLVYKHIVDTAPPYWQGLDFVLTQLSELAGE
jgi:tetratricopeptide (TPR) repeat protein